MKKRRTGSFGAVFERELNRMVSRRLYAGVCVVLPLFCMVFMTTVFGNGQMDELPVGVVDRDFTAASRELVRTVDASPAFRVKSRYTDTAEAVDALQRADIYGFLEIPSGFESKTESGRKVQLPYFYHYALMSVGCQIADTFEALLEAYSAEPVIETAVAEGVPLQTAESFAIPVNMSDHILFNPDLDYTIYLGQPFFFVLFQILVLLATVYAIGSEIKFGTAEEWLRTARGDIFAAVGGKLLPYTVIFGIMAVAANFVLFSLARIPYQCSLGVLIFTALLFVVSTQAVAVFIFSLFPAMSIIISIVSMVGSLGATLSGVTFPIASMYPVFGYMALLLPVRHFTAASQSMLYGNAGLGYTWKSMAALMLFVLPAIAIMPRLKRAVQSRRYENIE